MHIKNLQKNNQIKNYHNQSYEYTIERDFYLFKFTKREIEIMKHIFCGNTAKKIGKILNISNRTVEKYIENLKYKFSCDNKTKLISICIDLGIYNVIKEYPRGEKTQ